MKVLGQKLLEAVKAKSAEFHQGKFRSLSETEAAQAAALDLIPFFSYEGMVPSIFTQIVSSVFSELLPRLQAASHKTIP